MARCDDHPAQAEAEMARVQGLMAVADDNLSDAVELLEAVEAESPGTPEEMKANSRRVNELDAEVARLKQEYREVEDELGRVQAFWYEDDFDRFEDHSE